MKTKIALRKEQRKLKRSGNKANLNASYKKSVKVASSESTPRSRKRQTENDGLDDSDKLRKLAKSQPNFYKLLKQDGLVKDVEVLSKGRHGASMDDDDQDDQMLKKYSKKLKIKDHNKVGDSFKKDGLDFLLDVVNSEDSESDSDRVGSDDGMASSNEYAESFEEEEPEYASQEEEEDEEELSNDSTVRGDPMHFFKERPKFTTSDENTEEFIRLSKQIKGQLNRLSSSNLESIFNTLESLYASNARNSCTSILINGIINAVADSFNLMDSFILNYSCLVAHLFHMVGQDVGAQFVQELVCRIEEVHMELCASAATTNDQEVANEVMSKKCLNLVCLISYLFMFNVVSSVLVFDLLNLFTKDLSETGVELVLKIIKICGKKLRASDTDALKEFITVLFANAKGRAESGRFKFLLEQVENLKNNKGNLKVSQSPDEFDMMLKVLKGSIKKRGSSELEALRCSLEDIRLIDDKGKWWLVGAACAVDHKVRQSVQENAVRMEQIQRNNSLLMLARKIGLNTEVRRNIFACIMSSDDILDAYEKIMKLSLTEVQQREIMRVLVFCCSREKSYNPFYTKLAQKFCALKTHHKVTLQFILWDFFKTIKLGVKATGKELTKITNTAQFYAYLIGNESLSISILRGMDFVSLVRTFESTELPDGLCVFLQVVISYLLMPSTLFEDKEVREYLRTIFLKAKKEEYSELRNGLIVVLVKVILDRLDDEVGVWVKHFGSQNPKLKENIRDLFQERLMYAKRILTGR
ncbi:hypothetical protein MP638_003515 [Amoeboaphelidium occidentale]|nr:hypothetical protein MP638_003515 [Amoeboaphelidium occidentale]